MLALRVLQLYGADMVTATRPLLRDPSPQVRREIAISLQDSKSDPVNSLVELSKEYDGQDRWYLEALGIGADKQWDTVLGAWLAEVGDKWNNPAGRDVIWRSRSARTAALLVKIINDKNLAAQERDHYFRSLDFLTGPEKDAALVELLTSASPAR